jgi:rfaE bifunctional protein kinase chain/domain
MSSNNPLPDFSRTRALVVGDVMLDRYWFGEVNRISPEAPVPVVHVARSEERPGGAANVARNIVALGAKAKLLSVIGADEAGKNLRALAESEGVDLNLHIDPALSTTVKLRVIGRQQQLLRIDFEAAPSDAVLQAQMQAFVAALSECDVVLLSDYGKGGLRHIEKMIAAARAQDKLVLVDPKGDDYARYHGATVLTPNSAELREVVGRWKDEADLAQRAQKLRERLGLRALLLTRSEEGMTLFYAGGALHEATKAREVYDVSGAGDTVIATLAVMLGSGASLADAVRVANHAAGIVVAKFGTAVVHPDQLRADLQQ